MLNPFYDYDFCFNFNHQPIIDTAISSYIPENHLADSVESALNIIKNTDIEFVFFPVDELLTKQNVQIDFSNLTFYQYPYLKNACSSNYDTVMETEESSNNEPCNQSYLIHATCRGEPTFLKEKIEDYFKSIGNDDDTIDLYKAYLAEIQNKFLKLDEMVSNQFMASKNSKLLWHVDADGIDKSPVMLISLTDRGTMFCDPKDKTMDKTNFSTISDNSFSNELENETYGDIKQKTLHECMFYETPKNHAAIFKSNVIHAIPETKQRLVLTFDFEQKLA
jgi:hypothetical protein